MFNILKFSIISIFLLINNSPIQSTSIERVFSLNKTYSLKNVPSKITSCKVKLSDGQFIDLTSLDDPASPRKANLGDYSYVFNPCILK